MATRASAFHIFQQGPSPIGWTCEAADGNDQTFAEGYGKTPQAALKNCQKAVAKEQKRRR